MTLVIEDALVEQLCEQHRILKRKLREVEDQLRNVIGPHWRADCGPYHIVLCDDGSAVVYLRSEW